VEVDAAETMAPALQKLEMEQKALQNISANLKTETHNLVQLLN
jgi:hypothetical protein